MAGLARRHADRGAPDGWCPTHGWQVAQSWGCGYFYFWACPVCGDALEDEDPNEREEEEGEDDEEEGEEGDNR